MMFGEPPYAAGRASLLAWRLFPHLAGLSRLRLVNESGSSVLELARFELSVFPGLLSCPAMLLAFVKHHSTKRGPDPNVCVGVCVCVCGWCAVCVCMCAGARARGRTYVCEEQRR